MNIFKLELKFIFIIFSIFLISVLLYFQINSEEINMSEIKNINEYKFTKSTKPSQSKWNRNQCNYIIGDTLLNELNNNKIEQSNDEWNLYLPCTYDDIRSEVNMMPVVDNAKYFLLENCDEIVAKELLWKNIVNHFDINKAKIMMPNSYVLYDQNDVNKINSEFDKSKIYIMKKNIQRQEGLKITNNLNEILNGYKNEGYVLVQELLQNPYTISGRKTNMRFYVLVVCNENNMSVYVHKDGFMYYTKDLFKVGSLEEGPNITTGYIDRQVYIDNPLTHEDLRNYLNKESRELLETEKRIREQGYKISEIYFNRIYHLIREIFTAFYGKINKVNGKTKFNKNNITFQLFGVDIAVDNQLNPTVMEVNKGPDLGAKDERDSKLKHGVVKDMFKIVGITEMNDCEETKFLKVLSIKNGNMSEVDKKFCSL